MLEKHPEYFEGRTNLALKTKWKKLNLTSNRVLLDELRKTIEVSNIKQSIKKKSEKRKTNNKKKFKKWSDLDTKNIVACQKKYGSKWSRILQAYPHIFKQRDRTSLRHKWQHLSSQPMKLSEISKEVESSKSIEKLNNIIKF